MDAARQPRSFNGRFTDVELIQVGGFGTVYRAHDNVLDINVAIKAPHKEVEGMGRLEIEARFVQEWRLAAALSHPGYVQVLYQGGEGVGLASTPYYAMSLVRGEELTKVIEVGVVPPRSAIGMVIEVTDALHALHRLGFVHRDLKPGNLMLRHDGRVVVMDLGNAKAIRQDAALGVGIHTAVKTRVEVAVVSSEYAAPEQLMLDGEIDERTDLYALALILWQLLVGQIEVPRQLKRMGDKLNHPQLAMIPVQLRKLLCGALQWDVSERVYRDAPAFIDALEEALETLPSDGSAGFYQLHCPDAPRSVRARVPVMLPTFDVLSGGSPTDPVSAAVLRMPPPPPTSAATIVAPAVTLPDEDEQDLVKTATLPHLSAWRRHTIPIVVALLLLGVGSLVASQHSFGQGSLNKSEVVQVESMGQSSIQSHDPESDVSMSDDEAAVTSPSIVKPTAPPKPMAKQAVTKAAVELPKASATSSEPAVTPHGTVKVSELPKAIRLTGPTGTYPVPGTVPPGSYTIEATFVSEQGDVKFTSVKAITIANGSTANIRCYPALMQCR